MTIDKVGAAVVQDMAMAREPRSDGPRRRTFSPAEKLALLAGYETAMEAGQGNGFLREHGLYSSLMSEWRRTRDAGLLRGKPAGAVVGRPTRGSGGDRPVAAGARHRAAEVGADRNSVGDHGKSSGALGGHLREHGHAAAVDTAMSGIYVELQAVMSHRAAARLTGVSRASAHRAR